MSATASLRLPRMKRAISITAVNPRTNQAFAKVCMNCPVCRRARRKQRGIAYELVRGVEGILCPFGRSYERVHNRKPHEPVTLQ